MGNGPWKRNRTNDLGLQKDYSRPHGMSENILERKLEGRKIDIAVISETKKKLRGSKELDK
ncbi:hypothetical protein C0J52_06660, partial [Blattella germanica]